MLITAIDKHIVTINYFSLLNLSYSNLYYRLRLPLLIGKLISNLRKSLSIAS